MEDLREAGSLHGAVASALGVDSTTIARVEVVPAAHRPENFTTEALDHVCASLVDGSSRRAFRKRLRPASSSPMWETIPVEFQGQVLADLNWMDEPRVYDSLVGRTVAPGLRLPRLLHVDRSNERIELWIEDVADVGAWNLERYRRTASALGRMAGRWTEASGAEELQMARRSIRTLFEGRVVNHDLRILGDDGFWRAPEVRRLADEELRAGLMWLASVVPAMLDRLDAAPHGLAHGDATPANFHEPGDGNVVGLDWSYAAFAAVGADLGQLVAGRIDSGESCDAHSECDLVALASEVVTSFCEGLQSEGSLVRSDDVRFAMAVHLAVRSAFSALLIDHRPDLDEGERHALLAGRAGLARVAVDLARAAAAG